MSDDFAAEIKLVRPIKTIRGEIDVLQLVKPTVKWIRNIGMPVSWEGSRTHVDTEAVARYIEKCGKLANGDADKLDLDDYIKALNVVTGFFTGGDSDPASDQSSES